MGSLETPPDRKLPEKDIVPNPVPDEFFSATNWPKC
jgi:hypothetical protein